MAIRTAVHEAGAIILEKLLSAVPETLDDGVVKCGAGHDCQLLDYRLKEIISVVGPVKVRRGYYYCRECRQGVVPSDRQLDIAGTMYSPGARRLMGHVGGKEAFEEGRRD